jgi:hypothetical protein
MLPVGAPRVRGIQSSEIFYCNVLIDTCLTIVWHLIVVLVEEIRRLRNWVMKYLQYGEKYVVEILPFLRHNLIPSFYLLGVSG